MENANERFFLTWTDSLEAGTAAVGGKGWNLARLLSLTGAFSPQPHIGSSLPRTDLATVLSDYPGK